MQDGNAVRDMTQPRMLGGRYELDGIVGRGGMAEVFRARDIRLDRIVAVKTLRDDLARDQTFQARFRREAQSAASLNHASIVAVYDTGEDMAGPVPVPYIVMEYVDGRTLRDLLRDDRRLLPERAAEITDGVLRALDYSHRNGIVHRDIKPGNVMLTRNGEVKVMDFGIARAVSDAQATMTQTAQVIGTAQYLSPEQARGERVDARSDLYSTGCLLYELLTGRPPFTGDSPVAIAYQHVKEDPIPPSRIDPEVPAWADAIVLKAMAKDPADRYQSAGEMRNDIQRALSGAPLAAQLRGGGYTQATRRMGAETAMAGRTGAIPPYEYGPDQGRGGQRKRKAWPWVVLAVLVALGVLIALGLEFVNGSTSDVTVPSVRGLSVASAKSALRADHLVVGSEVKQASTSIKKGQVIGTKPAAGSTEPKNTKVQLIVSSGAGNTTVPNVTHQSLSTAESLLRQAGLKWTTEMVSSAAPLNEVVRQSPAANSRATRGQTVTLFVSEHNLLRVPNVIGEPLGEAQSTLSGSPYNYIVQVKYSSGPDTNGYAPGTVFATSPGPQHALGPGRTIIVYVVQQASSSPSPSSSSPSPSPSTSSPTGP